MVTQPTRPSRRVPLDVPGRSNAANSDTRRWARPRAFTSAVLVVVACLLAPLSVIAVWADTVVSQTDRYVETVAPIASDPGVQTAVADEVTAAVMERLDVTAVTEQALGALADAENMPARVAVALPALAVPLTQGIEGFVRTQTREFVAGPRFQTLWAEMNRLAHARMVTLLEGGQGAAITAADDRIILDLAPVVREVSARLVDQGFTLAARIPTVERTFVLVESPGIGRAQRWYALLTALGAWLPVVAVSLLAAGVLLAHDRRRALLRGALGVAVSMAVLGGGLTLVRTLYVEATPAEALTSQAAGTIFELLVRFLRTGLRVTAVLSLLLALATFVTGPSSTAVRLRRRVRAAGRGFRVGPSGRNIPAEQAAHSSAMSRLDSERSGQTTHPNPRPGRSRLTRRKHDGNHPTRLASQARRQRRTLRNTGCRGCAG